LQELACACVVLLPGTQVDASDLIAFCRGKVASFKVPRHVLVMHEYPMTASGKVQKVKLRELSIKALGLPQA
jgi:fatty-acyl-CoA synthase